MADGERPTLEDERTVDGPKDLGDPMAQIGRYTVRRIIGAGGMGVVVAAHDPELGREVAIKLVNRADEHSRSRMIREARAMARLKHPNVVTVHEVLRSGDRASIVMELVEGGDLSAWRKQRPRGWREIIAAYVQAARGLAAAHRAGLVHRDFKPSNALIDGDGVVRVTDFGLVRSSTSPEEDVSESDGASILDATLTRTGDVVGTPAYMAPEQHAGGPLDARTDQWALACSLYEALYGYRPFDGASRGALSDAVLAGKLRDEPARTDVPRQIRAAIRRALSVDPAHRFATLDDFIVALSPSRRAWAHWALIATVVVAGAVAIALRDPRPRASSAGPAPSVAVVPLGASSEWLGTAVAELLSTELGTGDRFRVVPTDAVAAAARARGITLGAGDADLGALGKALAVDHVLSVATSEPGGGRVRVDLALRSGAGGAVVDRMRQDGREAELFDLVASLGDDVRERLGRAPLAGAERPAAPRSLEAARAFAEGLGALRRYEAERARGRFERAVELEPDNARYHAALSSAWQALQFPQKARDSAERAFALAGRLPQPERMFIEARHHQTARRFDRAAELYSALAAFFPENIEYRLALGELENEAGRPRDALATVDRLRAAGARDPRIELLDSAAARAVGDVGRAERAALAARSQSLELHAPAMAAIAEAAMCEVIATQDAERSLASCAAAIEQSAAAGDRATSARALLQTAHTLERRGDYDAADASLERARALYREMGNQRGAGITLVRAGTVLKARGDLDRALAMQREGLARVEEAGDELAAAGIISTIASTEVERGQLAAARQAYGRSIEIYRRLGVDKALAIAVQNLAWVELDVGEVAAARRHADESMGIQERLGLELDLIYSLDAAGVIAMTQDDPATAERLLLRALELREKVKLKKVATLQNLAEVRMVQGRLDAARELIGQSLAAASGGLDEGYAREVESRILLQAGDLDGAERAVARARELTGGRSRAQLDTDAARILTARKRPRQALVLAEQARAWADERAAVALRINAEAALGEAEMTAGVRTGPERLSRAATEAATRGYLLMSRQFKELHARLR